MKNEGVRIPLRRKHLLTIILYLIAWSTLLQKVFLVQGKQTILLTTLINIKQEIKNISTDTRQTLANDSNVYFVEQVKKHRHRNGKLRASD